MNEGGGNFYAASPVVFEDGRDDLFPCLGADGDSAVGAVLPAQTDEEKAEEVVDLRDRCDGTLPASPAAALFDRNGGRKAAYPVYLGPGRGLDNGLKFPRNLNDLPI